MLSTPKQVTMHGPFVNLNGAARDSLVEQASRVIDACEALSKAIAQAMPHGRDYQQTPEQQVVYKYDRAQAESFLTAVGFIKASYQQYGERLVLEQFEEKS